MTELVAIGKIQSPHGLQGWVKILSYSDPREALFDYGQYQLRSPQTGEICLALNLKAHRSQGKGWVAQFAEVADRTAAELWQNHELCVAAEQLVSNAENGYYWRDLEGLQVINLQDETLGRVSYLFRTGANDVMHVEGEKIHMVPFIHEAYVHSIDLEKGVIVVDWDSNF